jgi:serine protease Do
MERILIKHQTGSKANQTEAFSLADFISITFGRDSSVEVKYDPDRDDLVSRQHARITRESNNPGQFILTDLNSRNGTFVNKSRINSPYHLNHGDQVQFGVGGPELVFELDPPPVNPAKQTRLSSDLGGGQATREIPPETQERKTNDTQPHQPGRMTSLERRIEEERYDMENKLEREKAVTHNKLEKEKENSRWRMIYMGLTLFFIVLFSAAGLYIWDKKNQEKLEVAHSEISKAKEIADKADIEIQKMQEIKTPQQIAGSFSKSTVFVRASWELVDSKGRKIYHRYIKGFPAYEEFKDGTIEPILTMSEKEGLPIANDTEGSGFVISSSGYILTNRKTAAPWRSPCTCMLDLPGTLYVTDKKRRLVVKRTLHEDERSLLSWWKPKTSLDRYQIDMEGRHIKLTVTFPNTSLPFPARLVRMSDKADVALLRFDSPSPLEQPDTDDKQEHVKQGDYVTVLGYPAASANPLISIKSKEPINFERETRIVPFPTITSGLIGKIIEDVPETGHSGDQYLNYMGDSYQLSIDSGKGNGGGPVINNLGKIIGVYSFETKSSGPSIAYAVPIKYGLALLSYTPD